MKQGGALGTLCISMTSSILSGTVSYIVNLQLTFCITILTLFFQLNHCNITDAFDVDVEVILTDQTEKQ